MNRYHPLTVIAAVFVGACAAPDTQPAQRAEDQVYLTGSRLPVRDNGANAAAAAVADKNPQRGIKDDLMKGTINPVKTSN